VHARRQGAPDSAVPVVGYGVPAGRCPDGRFGGWSCRRLTDGFGTLTGTQSSNAERRRR